MKTFINEKLNKSREIPREVRMLPVKQQKGVQEYINKGFSFIRVQEYRSPYGRFHKYVILKTIDGETVTINKNGNNRHLYGY